MDKPFIYLARDDGLGIFIPIRFCRVILNYKWRDVLNNISINRGHPCK